MHGAETHQISTIIQQRYLSFNSDASVAIDMLGFNSIQFLAGMASNGPISMEIEQSPDGVNNWTPVIPAYYKADGMDSSAEGTSVLKVSTTTTKINSLVAVSLYHQGREKTINGGIDRFLRVKLTGVPTFILATLGQASWHPVTQPSYAVAETKGTVG